MGRETLEPQELAEPEEPGGRGRSRLSTRVALTAAVLAVLASLSALQAERTAAEAIIKKNDAVLWQARASDEWAYRQAKSIKLHLQELAPGGARDAEAQRAELVASEERARESERRRDEANQESSERFEQHHRFAVATSLLQIAIVLATVAVVVDRAGMWYAGLGAGLLGAAAFLNGFLGII